MAHGAAEPGGLRVLRLGVELARLAFDLLDGARVRATVVGCLGPMVVSLAENSHAMAATMFFTATLRRMAPFSREDASGDDRQPEGGV